MSLELHDLVGLDVPGDAQGRPLSLDLETIDEDAGQPRSEFDADALRQLADSIALRGVLQPVSVRRHPDRPGRWLLNFGARRLRASRLAGRATIPAFEDDRFDSYDQVIENEQRAGLTPLELALFVQKRLAGGESQAEIARRMGKSRAYVTHATALIDAPDWVMSVYREGRCKGLSDLYELRRLHERHPAAVEARASELEAITRERIRSMVDDLDRQRESAPAERTRHDTPTSDATTNVTPDAEAPQSGPRNRSKPLLRAMLDGVVVVLDTDVVPAEAGHVFVRADGDGAAKAVAAGRLLLMGFAGTGC